MARTCWLHEMRWPEIEAYLAHDDLVLVPIGATEQHGRHLPMLVDTGWAVAASEGAARQTGAIVAPPLHYGWSPHHMGYPGTITLRADTLRQVAVDVGESLIHHGFRKILFVNGNRIANLPPLEIAIVELKNRTGAWAGIADAGLIAKVEVAGMASAPDGGLEHAAEVETAFALHWAGEHVDLAAASAPRSSNAPKRARFAWTIELDPKLAGNSVSYAISPDEHRQATAPDGVNGDPTGATAEAGRRILEALVANLAAFIEQVRRVQVGEVRAAAPY